MEFLAEAQSLPEEYAGYVQPPLDEGLRIPAKNDRVGDIEILVFESFISVKIGRHTELRFSSGMGAAAYLKDVLTDKIVFHFQADGVEYFHADEFESLSEADWDYHVWSGPFPYAFLNK